MVRRKCIRQIFQVVFGLFIFSVGSYLTIFAGIGLGPWDCLSMGAQSHLPFTYGVTHMLIGLIILVIDVLIGEQIGLGTVLDALLVGPFCDLFMAVNPLVLPDSMLIRVLVLLCGLPICALGQYFYMSAAMSCGPRDALLVGLGKRVPKVPIGVVNCFLLACALLAGWLLGGPVGFGTILIVFCLGLAQQLVFRLIRYEPRDTVHVDILTSLRRLILGRE